MKRPLVNFWQKLLPERGFPMPSSLTTVTLLVLLLGGYDEGVVAG